MCPGMFIFPILVTWAVFLLCIIYLYFICAHRFFSKYICDQVWTLSAKIEVS